MVMRLVLMSIVVTGLLLTGSDVSASISLTPQQQKFLRQWILRNQNASQLRVVWQPAALSSRPRARSEVARQAPRWIRKPRFISDHAESVAVLKAGPSGYASQPPAPAPPPPQVYIISAPPAQPPAPSYSPPPPPPPAPRPMPTHYRAESVPAPVVQQASSYPVPASMPVMQPSPASYRVIYVQPEPAVPRAKPLHHASPAPAPPAPAPAPSYGAAAVAPPVVAPAPAPAHAPVHAPAPAAAASPTSSAAQTLLVVVPASSATSSGQGVGTVHMSYSQPALPPCPPAPANFCYSKYVGHYEHPSDQTCYIVCNDFGHGFTHRCARGTKWKKYGEGSVPSGYNRCS